MLFRKFYLFLFLTILNAGKFNIYSQTYQWAKQGVSEGYDYGNALAVDDSGNVYIAGQIEYTAVFDGVVLSGAGQHDIVFGKYKSDGSLSWIKKAGGKTGDVGWGAGFDKFHNFYMAGEFENTCVFGPNDSITASGPNDGYIAKYSPTGNVSWIRRMGGGNDDKARALVTDENGNSYVTGFFTNTGSFGGINISSNGGNDVFIAKYNSAGTCKWVKKAGGSREDRGRGIALDKSGNVYVVGTFTQSINFNGTNFSSQGKNSAFIAKYDSSGNYKWAKIAGACCDTSRYVAVTCDDAGNIYTAGYFQNAMTVGSTNLSSKGNTDVVISKYSSAGNVLWSKNEGGANEDAAYGIHFDKNKGFLYVTGFYDYQADFGSTRLSSVGNRDAFLAAYDAGGNVQWVRSAGGNGRDGGLALGSDTAGNIYQSGYFNYYADFDSHHLTGDTLPDFFLSKLSPAPAPQPTTASSAVITTVVNCNDLQLNWTPGNGNNRIVIARTSQSPNILPSDGVTYTAAASFGSGQNLGNGNFIVYNGNGNSTLVTGLTQGVQYTFTIIEYNGYNNITNYNTSLYASIAATVNGFALNLSSSSTSVCLGNQTTLTASGGVAYQWSPSYGLSATSGSSVNASPAISTTYTVTGTNNMGCQSVERIVVYVNPLPAVQYNQPGNACVNSGSVILSGGTPAGGVFSGSNVNGNTFNPSSAGTGNHIITYIYTDANGCVSSDTSLFVVNALPAITMPVFQGICISNQAVTLTGATPAGGQYSGIAVSSNNFDPSVAGVGSSLITYTYTDNNGCQNSGSAYINVSALPVVSQTALQNICLNAPSFALSSGAPAGGRYSGAGVSSGSFSPSVAGPGTHTINYQYTDNNGCANSATTSITVNELPSVSFANLSPVCIDQVPLIITGGTPAGGTYTGTGVSNNIFDPTVSGAGVFQLTYSYTDSAGCTNSANQTMKVNPLPQTTFVIPSDVCQNSAPLSLLGGYPAGGIYSGPFVMNGIFYPTNATPGIHSITYTYTDNNNCTGSTNKNLQVRSQPLVELGADSVVCTGSSILIDAGPGFATYYWSNGASTQTIQVTNNSAVTVNIAVSVTDSYNCSNTDTIRIIFDNCAGITAVNTDYPWCYIYPNPFRTDFTMFSEKRLHVVIYDVSGRIISEQECEGSIITGQDLSPGIYFIDALYKGQRKTYKVIKAE